MPDQPSFVVNDRRKFTAEGDLRQETASGSPTSSSPAETAEPQRHSPGDEASGSLARGPQLVSSELPSSAPLSELADLPESEALGALDSFDSAEEPSQEIAPAGADDPNADFLIGNDLPPGPSAEQASEAARAYAATVDRLDTAMRAANPGGERMPVMNFDRLVQSLYTQALLLLGGGAEPGETPRVDILGARQTIDMLVVIDEKTRGNRSGEEDKLLQTALFDLHMGFLEITQALARQAAQRGPGITPGSAPGMGSGPRIVR